MALSANKARPHLLTFRQVMQFPVNAGSIIYVGAYVCREAATGVVIPGADAAGLIPLGVAVPQEYESDPDKTLNAAFDNTTGADGVINAAAEQFDRCINVQQSGLHDFAVTGGTPKPGDPAYLVDDDTVSPVNPGQGIIAGTFARPGTLGWFIDIARRGLLLTAEPAEAVTLGLSGAGTTQGTATALTAFGLAEFTTVGANSGARLPAGVAGKSILVVNQGANALNVYPASGGSIDAAAADAAVAVAAGTAIRFAAVSATKWYTHPTV